MMLAILVISSKPAEERPAWATALARSGARLLYAAGEREALRVLRVTGEIGVVVLDHAATGIEPGAFAQALGTQAAGPRPELWLVTGDATTDAEHGELLASGVDGALRIGCDAALLQGALRAALARSHRVHALHAAHVTLARTQLADGDTGLYNGRYLRMRLGEELERSARERRPISVMLVELPIVLTAEERQGREAALALLRQLVGRVRQVLRNYDVLCRAASHRLAVVLPDAEPTVAAALAQRLIETLHGQPAAVAPDDVQPVTLQVALAGFVEGSAAVSAGRLLQRLEQALAEAPEAGGPVVCSV